MKVSEQIKDIVKHKELTITDLASLMDTSQANLANKLVRDNFKLSDIVQILNALGYGDIEIVARDHNETVVISKADVEFKTHLKYLRFSTSKSVEDVLESCRHNRKFKDLAFDLIEPLLKPRFGDLWDTYIPSEFEEGFKDTLSKKISFDEFANKIYKSDVSED